ncbi:MAG TPA: ATP-dependent DNA helicase RecG [bacterium]|nr:ATP-dependent DNA helicase RecG [bacterium]
MPERRTPSDFWTSEVTYVKGVGPVRARFLHTQGIDTVADLLLHLPRRYLDRSNIAAIRDVLPGTTVTVMGRIIAAGVLPGRKKRFEAILADGTGRIALLWFAGWRWLQEVVKKGVVLAASGEVGQYFENTQILHPELEFLEDVDADDLTHTGRIIPVYAGGEPWLKVGLASRSLRRIIKPLLDGPVAALADYLPDSVRQRHGLLPLPEALAQAHFPDSLDRAEAARRRLAFDELLFLEMAMADRRATIDARHDGRACAAAGRLASKIINHLPWPLTAAQRRVTDEIAADLRAPRAMRRLLQGDVGSGKTIVAALAMSRWIEDGAQAALLVPTEILAEQHHHNLLRLFKPAGIVPTLLTGSLRAKPKRAAQAAIANGEARLIVGTHALLTGKVAFADLGMVVIDEQHRFGVAQREALVAKGRRPDLLVMTATPIPRTLAMTIYGDLDVSVLNEKPPQKGTIKTVWRTEEARDKIYEYIRDTTAKGNLVYIVYPLVESSEKMDLKAANDAYADLCARFPDRRLGLVTGRTPPEERAAVMAEFYGGRLHILVATTVIEVGVDAPDARLMIIENAERFGLSQLHQLRGRIGRGPGQSVCVLMLGGRPTAVAAERLETMCRTDDGFEIAEVDLRLRGPGEFLGTKQHGIPELKVAHLLKDAALIEPARAAAFELAAHPRAALAPLWNEWARRFGQRTRFLHAG